MVLLTKELTESPGKIFSLNHFVKNIKVQNPVSAKI
jgi:hypothetical protein